MERVLFAPRALLPPRPDVAEDPKAYESWVTDRERQPADPPPTGGTRVLTLITLVADEPTEALRRTLESLECQTCPKWTLLIAVPRSGAAAVTSAVNNSGFRRDNRIRILPLDDGTGYAALFDAAVQAAAGTDVALLFPGDSWAPVAVALLRSALTECDVAYADEDVLNGDGVHVQPRLKPAFSPEFLLHSFYTGRPLAIGSKIIARIPQPSGSDGSFEHDLALRASEAADRVLHVSEVLCHRTTGRTSYFSDGALETRHVTTALERRAEAAEVLPGSHPGVYRIRRRLSHTPTVSIVVPFRDEPRFLRACIDSVDATTAGVDVQFVLVDNGSVQPETATLVERLAGRSDTRVIFDNHPFNWAYLNNLAAREASGEVLLFLNNDVEALSSGWLLAMCGQVLQRDVAAVGARLLYPDRRLQHCGVVLGLGGAAGHLLVGLDENDPGYLNMAATARECTAVTGACMATSRATFDMLHGFDEDLGVDLNDIDYCLRAMRYGMRVIYEPAAELIHHESPSRGTAGDVRDIVHFVDRWERSLAEGDPYLNPLLTRRDSSCALRDQHEAEWWQQWRRSLTHHE